MSFLKNLFKAVAIGTLVFMTGGAAAAFFAGKAIAWGTLAIQGAVLSGLGTVVSYLSRPSVDRQAANDRLNMTINANAEGKFVFGETASGTDVVYQEKIGDDKVLYIVAAAWHEIESYGKLYFNDEEITLDSNGVSTGAWAGAVKVYRNLGELTQDALVIPTSTWPPSAKGAGVAHFALLFDLAGEKGQEKLGGGVPSRITQVIKGAKVYDPRLDTSIGGSGSHRVDDQSTWTWSANWALIVAHYLLGYRQNGKLIYGVGVEAGDIDWQQVADMAAVCDTVVDGNKKYEIGGIIPISNDHEAVIKQFESAIDGKVAKIGGKYYIYAPHDDTADIKMVITDDDIIAQSGVNFSPSAGLQTLYNTATGQYISPAQLYQFVSYPEVVETAALEDDGKARIVQYDFAMIQNEAIAQRVARERIRRSRFTASMSLAMGPKYIALKPFDVVQINIKETNNQPELFRVIRIVGSVNGYAEVEFIEEDASIYDVSSPLGPSLTQLSPSAYDPTQVITPVNVQATNVVVQGDTSAKDAIRVTWNSPGAFVENTEVRYRVTGSGTDYAYVQTTSLASAIIAPVEPLTEYDIEVRHVTRELVLSDYVQITHISGNETLNIIRQSQIDELVPNTPFAAFIQSEAQRIQDELTGLSDVLGGVDGILEEVAQDIQEVYQRSSVEDKVRQVEINNLAQIETLVDEYLTTLEGETLPELNARLTVAEADINTLETVTIPAVNVRLNEAESDITTINSTTIPQVQAELLDVENQLTALNEQTLPLVGQVPFTVDLLIEEVAQDISEVYGRTDAVNNEAVARKAAIAQVESDLTQLNTVTLPALQFDLAQAELDIAQLDGLFPITETSISDGAISTPKIQTNAITADKIVAGAVTTDKMTANTINGDRIAANSLAASKIVANSITSDQIAARTITASRIGVGAITADEIAALTITSAKMAALSITTDKLAAFAVTADKIEANAVTAVKIAANAVEADKILANAVTAAKIAANAVTADKIAANAVTADKIAANSVTAAKIAAATITGDKIAANTIEAANIAVGTITANEIAAATISGDKIAANTISGDKIISNTIVGDLIAARTIGASNIIVGSLTGSEIAARTIEAVNIATDSITSNEIKAGTITAANIAALTITGDKIAANTIAADKIVANSLTSDQIAANAITAIELAAGSVTAVKLDAEAIYGKRQVLTANDISIVSDPGTVELTSDLVMWIGASSNTTAASRTRDNALFFVSTDGKVSSNISGGRVAGQLVTTSNSSGTNVVTDRRFTMRSNKGIVELTGVTGWVNISGGLTFSGTIGQLFMDFNIRNITTGTLLGSKRVPMSYNASTGSAFTNENNLPFFAEDDLSSSNYGDEFVYSIEMVPAWIGTGTITGTWVTSTGAQIPHPKVKAYQFIVTF